MNVMLNESNNSVVKLGDLIAITHFRSKTRQLFETEFGSYVYYIDEQKLHKLTTDSYTRLLIKLSHFIEHHVMDNPNE